VSEHETWVRHWVWRLAAGYALLCLAIAGWLAYRTW
jgi:hypothetical protein